MDSVFLTERQTAVLDAIKTLTARHGMPPTVREIGEHCGISGSVATRRHLANLEKKGLLLPHQPRTARSIRLADAVKQAA